MLKKVFILSSSIILFAISVGAQCLDRDSLWKRLNFLRNSSNTSPSEQLKELLGYEACPYGDDSTHALLLQRIGVVYSDQSDYVKALQYIRQSINTPGKG